jgi:phosphotransferase system  glucose/maltose/N-acetylglucosamine-specific IIC component
VNQYLLGALFLIAVLYVALKQTPELPVLLERIADSTSFVALIFLVLLPLAMTMALIWKTKEVILDNVFGGESGAGR